MNDSLQRFDALTQELQLVPGDDGNYIGHLNGFPIGLKFIDPEGSGLLLFHTRHLLPAEAKELASVAYDSEIISLVEEKRLEITHDDRTTRFLSS